MKQRCYNPSNMHYARYGGRGIKICDEWLGTDGACSFYEWSLAHGYADNLTIDRVDNDGDYSPENCIWITASANASRSGESETTLKIINAIASAPTRDIRYLVKLIEKVENKEERELLTRLYNNRQKHAKPRRQPNEKSPDA